MNEFILDKRTYFRSASLLYIKTLSCVRTRGYYTRAHTLLLLLLCKCLRRDGNDSISRNRAPTLILKIPHSHQIISS